jgi:hypothetical protein
MAILMNKPIKECGYTIVYDGHPPQDTELDDAGCASKAGFKSIEACLRHIKEQDLIADHKDIILLFGINSEGFMVVTKPFGILSGEELLGIA